jgi:hypothetical protein
MMARTSWHPAFFGAIQLELDEYRNVLEFTSEHQLTSEPLKIDVVIIKKLADVAIQKNIARIFRQYNLIEYKSPSVSVSIDDYYKMQGCCWLYSAFEHIDIKNLSMTMVITKHSPKLLNDIKCRLGITSAQQGIYLVENNPIPTQIVISSELPETENFCLTCLNKKIKFNQLEHVTTEIISHKQNAAVAAFWDVVVGANFQTFQKLMETKDMKTLTQHLKEMGLLDKWFAEELAEVHAEVHAEVLAEAEAKRKADKLEAARKLKRRGVDYETIVEAIGLPLKEVKRLK